MNRLRRKCGESLRARLVIGGAFIFLVGFAATGCVGAPPVEEYNLARAAHEAANEAESSRYAQGLWYKADEAYNNAVKLFKDRQHDEAREEFANARELLEKAENAARIQRVQSGGVPQ